MEEIKRKPLFNPKGDIDVRNRRMINFNTTNINDFNNMRYEWVSDWYRQAMNNFWVPEEINLNQDKSDYPKLSEAERRAYDKILSFLVYLDSLQSANLPNISQYVTANEVNLCLSIQTFQECIHSQSYSYMLDTICNPTERNDILYQWKTDEHLLRRNEFIGNLYNEFVEKQSKDSFLRVNRDENTHLWLFRNMLLELKKEEPELFDEAHIAEITEMVKKGVEQEIAWGQYVIGDSIPGLNGKMVEDYIRYLGNLRYRSLGLPNLYEGYEKEPESMKWVSQYADANMVKTDFFEARSTAYAKSTAIEDDL